MYIKLIRDEKDSNFDDSAGVGSGVGSLPDSAGYNTHSQQELLLRQQLVHAVLHLLLRFGVAERQYWA